MISISKQWLLCINFANAFWLVLYAMNYNYCVELLLCTEHLTNDVDTFYIFLSDRKYLSSMFRGDYGILAVPPMSFVWHITGYCNKMLQGNKETVDILYIALLWSAIYDGWYDTLASVVVCDRNSKPIGIMPRVGYCSAIVKQIVLGNFPT